MYHKNEFCERVGSRILKADGNEHSLLNWTSSEWTSAVVGQSINSDGIPVSALQIFITNQVTSKDLCNNSSVIIFVCGLHGLFTIQKVKLENSTSGLTS